MRLVVIVDSSRVDVLLVDSRLYRLSRALCSSCHSLRASAKSLSLSGVRQRRTCNSVTQPAVPVAHALACGMLRAITNQVMHARGPLWLCVCCRVCNKSQEENNVECVRSTVEAKASPDACCRSTHCRRWLRWFWFGLWCKKSLVQHLVYYTSSYDILSLNVVEHISWLHESTYNQMHCNLTHIKLLLT